MMTMARRFSFLLTLLPLFFATTKITMAHVAIVTSKSWVPFQLMEEVKKRGEKLLVITDTPPQIPQDFSLEDINSGVVSFCLIPILNEANKQFIHLCAKSVQASAIFSMEEQLLELTMPDGLYFRDKLLMKERLLKNGYDKITPFLGNLHSPQLVKEFIKTYDFPVILKPKDEMGADGIIIVKSQEEFEQLEETKDISNSSLFMEKYMSGEVYHVDGVVLDGEILFVRPSRYSLGMFSFYQEGIAAYSIELDGEKKKEILQETQEVIKAMEYERGIFHLEFIRNEKGELHFMEIAARVGGGMINNRAAISFNVDFHRINSQLFLGGEDSEIKKMLLDKTEELEKKPLYVADLEVPLHPENSDNNSCIFRHFDLKEKTLNEMSTLYWHQAPNEGELVKMEKFPTIKFLFQGHDLRAIEREVEFITHEIIYQCD